MKKFWEHWLRNTGTRYQKIFITQFSQNTKLNMCNGSNESGVKENQNEVIEWRRRTIEGLRYVGINSEKRGS